MYDNALTVDFNRFTTDKKQNPFVLSRPNTWNEAANTSFHALFYNFILLLHIIWFMTWSTVSGGQLKTWKHCPFLHSSVWKSYFGYFFFKSAIPFYCIWLAFAVRRKISEHQLTERAASGPTNQIRHWCFCSPSEGQDSVCFCCFQ